MNTKFDEILDFPCQFGFRVMGLADERLPDMVNEVLQKHAPGDYSPTCKPSSGGKYHSLSYHVTVTSKEHIELLYRELSDIELVRYVL